MTGKLRTYNFKRLEKNISDMIYEGLTKIGYKERQRISVYYDIGLLSHLLDLTTPLSKEECRDCLKEFKEYCSPRFHDIAIKRQGERFEFNVSEEGVDYIHNHNESRFFLHQLVKALNEKNCTLEQIKAVFKEVSEDIAIDEIDNDEFQYVIHFKDKSIDEFNYCFTFDEMGHYYHRLLDYDFEQVIACEH